MRLCNNFCINCGAAYTFQASGHYQLITPKEYNDQDYCPECKKALVDALSKIQKKTELRFVNCDDVTLEFLFQKDNEQFEANKKLAFPIGRKVFAEMFDTQRNESTYTNEISIDGVRYRYQYWNKSKELIFIKKEVRFDLINNKPL